MKAVMYGGGNIGRGFIGALFAQSGYKVTFIDVAERVIETLNAEHRYPVRIVSNEGFEDLEITGVDAVSGNDSAAAAQAIADADIMATAVGVNVLKFIIPNIVAGIRRRFATTSRPLNIIICENLNDANKIIEGMIKEQLTAEEITLFDQRIGLVEAAIGRMVPVQTPEMQSGEPLRVCVERYGFLPVDKAAFKGEIPVINNMIPFTPFDFYIKRKLFIHNMGHATCAYLGGYSGREYIAESIADNEIHIVVQGAMLESAQALSKQYGVDITEIINNIDDLLRRFTNSALMDTCQRVGGDPKRKLQPSDRLVGAALLCLQHGIVPACICTGIAGAVWRYINENNMEQTADSAISVLHDVSGLTADSPLTENVLQIYHQFRQRNPLSAIRQAAADIRAKTLGDIV